MAKQEIYEINICNQGRIETIAPLTKKEKNKWLMDYFTVGEERLWAWGEYEKYGHHCNTFEKFVKWLIKQESGMGVQSFHIRKGKAILIREKK